MGITPQPKKDLRTLTTLEREKEVSRLRGETEELVEAMGAVDEQKAAPVVQEVMKEQQAEQLQERERDIEILKGFSNNKKTYQRYLIAILQRFIKEESIPKKYSLWAESTDEGIVVGIEKTTLTGAFRVCGDPFYDANACKILAVQVGNTVAKMEGKFRQTESGILLADKRDLEIATGTYGKPSR